MPRIRVPKDPFLPFHATGRVQNREVFPIPLSDVWDIFQHRLYYISRVFDVQVLSFVLMPNHFHAILRDPNQQRSEAMADLQRETAKEINSRSRRMNHLWGRPYFSSILTSTHYYLNCYKYVYQNPVRAGLCDFTERYPFSTLHGLLGQSHLFIPVVEDDTLFENVEGTLKWLNTKPVDEDLSAIRQGLRRRVFYLPTNRKTKRPHRLETTLM